MLEFLLWLGTFVLLLIAFIIGISVLRNIFHEGKERYRSQSRGERSDSSGIAEESGTTTGDRTPESTQRTAGASTDAVVCNHCNTPNDPAYTYCQECTERL